MDQKFKCPECNRELRTMVSNYEKGRHYAIEHCDKCLRDYQHETVDGKLLYFKRYFHG